MPRGTVLSAEPTTTTQPATGEHVETCAACGAALAPDQRYCLECGERRATMSSVLLGGLPGRGQAQAPEPPPTPPTPPGPVGGGSAAGGEPRSAGLVTVLAGIGVLLLAMGVGVLIGRSGSSSGKAAAPTAQVISVSTPSAAGSSAAPAAEASFSSDWPAGTSGYTVQLQTLPQSGTQVSAVEAAKSSASAKGAKSVGALKSEEFSSLPSGEYVIYSGVYHQHSQAQSALGPLKKSFPGASVIKVSSGSSASSSSGSSASEASGSGSHGSSGAGSSETHPAPPSVVEHLNKKKGQSYEQESKNLPNVISTG
jgi:hypothetical protein